MKPYIKIYLDYFGFGLDSFISCEICGNRAVDIHHIINRKRGGDPTGSKNRANNMMALCRNCHLSHGDVPEKIEQLQNMHLKYMEENGITNL